MSTLTMTVTPANPGPADDITVTMGVTGGPDHLTFQLSGSAQLADGEVVTGSGQFTVGTTYTLAPVAGYTIATDPANPGVFVLHPAST